MESSKFEKLMPIWAELDKQLLAKDARLASDMRNVDNIELYIENRQLPWNIENVMQAVDNLHKLGLVVWFRSPAPPPPPVVKTAAQIQREQAEKGEAKMRKDYLDSLKPQRVLEVEKLNSENA